MENDPKYERLLRRISNNIKALREKRGLTQEDMTGHGFNYRHYQKLESGSYSFSLHTLYRVSEVLKVDLKELLK